MAGAKNLLCHARSFCFDDLASDLQSALLRKDLTAFADIAAAEKTADPNKLRRDGALCLEIICASDGFEDFARILFEAGADPNQWVQSRGCALVHLAVESGNFKMLKLLIENDADMNRTNEFGRTPLHIAVSSCCDKDLTLIEKHNVQRCLTVLLRTKSLETNVFDNKGWTPLHIAVSRQSPDMVQRLLSMGADATQLLDGVPLKNLIEERFPTVAVKAGHQLPKANESDLHMALQSLDLLRFEMIIEGGNLNLNKPHGGFTCLQFACYKGLDEFARLLLQHKADPNAVSANNPTHPLLYAAEGGHHALVKMLLEYGADINCTDNRKDTPLHKVIRQHKAEVRDRQTDYEKCLETLLGHDEESRLDVNSQDCLGNTPLHYAVLYGTHKAIKMLLKHRANFGIKNNQGDRPISRIKADVLHEFLDECLETNDNEFNSDDLELTFDYSFLVPPEIPENSNFPETECLWYMSQHKTHRELFKHPIIVSFLHLKWSKVKKYFLINCCFFIAFVALLTAFVMAKFEKNQQVHAENLTADAAGEGHPHSSAMGVLRYFILVLTVVLALREVFQMIVSPIRYFFLVENLLEWCIISLVAAVVFDVHNGVSERGLAALLLLFTWAELVMLFGRHPRFSIHVRMFLTVSVNFLIFIAWYAVLLLAFAFSFHILFVAENSFATLHSALMKTLVMMTGEFDFSEMPLEEKTPVGQLIFAAFLFLIPIVLMNLLTGLAVSDTQAIRDEAKVFGLLGLVDLVSYLEAMLLGDPFSFLANYPPFKWLPQLAPCRVLKHWLPIHQLVSYFSTRILLFRHCFPEYKLRTYPNRSYKKIKLPCQCALSLPSSCIKEAFAIVMKRTSKSDNLLLQLQAEISEVKKCMQNIETNIRILGKSVLQPL